VSPDPVGASRWTYRRSNRFWGFGLPLLDGTLGERFTVSSYLSNGLLLHAFGLRSFRRCRRWRWKRSRRGRRGRRQLAPANFPYSSFHRRWFHYGNRTSSILMLTKGKPPVLTFANNLWRLRGRGVNPSIQIFFGRSFFPLIGHRDILHRRRWS
jgi:hypothetical protein